MAWEDLTPAEQAAADQEAARYRDTDDDHDYVVQKGSARFVVHGINSARVVAGKTGTIRRK
jgi:hypothetical protein